MNSMKALPPHVAAKVGPVGTPTRQSQELGDMFQAAKKNFRSQLQTNLRQLSFSGVGGNSETLSVIKRRNEKT